MDVAADHAVEAARFGLAPQVGGGGIVVFLAIQGLTALAVAMGAFVVLAVILTALVHSALSGIYSAVLYRYAVAGDAPQGFDGMLLQDAFQRKM